MSLRCLDFEVTSVSQIGDIPFISTTIKEAINYVLKNGSLKDFPRLRNGEAHQPISDMIQIWGAGPATAWEWYNQGYRSLRDVVLAVKEKRLIVSAQVRAFVEYHEDLLEPVPREEVARLAKRV